MILRRLLFYLVGATYLLPLPNYVLSMYLSKRRYYGVARGRERVIGMNKINIEPMISKAEM